MGYGTVLLLYGTVLLRYGTVLLLYGTVLLRYGTVLMLYGTVLLLYVYGYGPVTKSILLLYYLNALKRFEIELTS